MSRRFSDASWQTHEFREGVRESMARLPGWMQPILTWITGKPLPGEQPLMQLNPLTDLVLTVTLLVAGISAQLYVLTHSVLAGLLLMPAGWILSTGLLRKIQVVFGHHCVHRHFVSGGAAANDWVLNVLTTLTLVQSGPEYRRDHLGHHNRALFTTREDADAALLHQLGFVPGRSRAALWRSFFLKLGSVSLHLTFLRARLRSNFISRPLVWRLASMLWASLITVGLGVALGWWQVALIIWVPVFLLYNVSALIQFITEHAWVMGGPTLDTTAYAERCWGRFLGERCPSVGAGNLRDMAQWLKWGGRMFFVHAPARLGCFVGDLPAHDWHHLCSLVRRDPSRWPVAIFARQEMIDAGQGLGMEHRELWGLRSMLNHVFSTMENADEDLHVLAQRKAA